MPLKEGTGKFSNATLAVSPHCTTAPTPATRTLRAVTGARIDEPSHHHDHAGFVRESPTSRPSVTFTATVVPQYSGTPTVRSHLRMEPRPWARFGSEADGRPFHRQRPPLCNSQVGSYNYFFGACSAFTHVIACTLAESPGDPPHRKLRQLRCLRCRFDCYRVERTSSRAGVAPAEVQRIFTAHYYVN